MKKYGILKKGYIAIEGVIVGALVLSVGFFAMLSFTNVGAQATERLASVLEFDNPSNNLELGFDSNGYAKALHINLADVNPLSDFVFEDLGLSYRIINYLNDTDTDVIIPKYNDGKPVIEIANNAFTSKGLTSVAIPDSIVNIGDAAFTRNILSSVILPDSITYMGIDTFSYNQLTAFKFSEGMKEVPYNTFNDNQLTSITIPDSVEIIGYAAFARNQISSLEIPSGVTFINTYAFQGNGMETLSVLGTTRMGNSAFGNNALTSVEFYGENDMNGGDTFLWEGEVAIFDSNPTLTTNTIKVKAGQLENFKTYALKYGVDTNAFYE